MARRPCIEFAGTFYHIISRRDHGEAEAEKFLKRGLGVLGVKEQDLKKITRGVKEKQVLAWCSALFFWEAQFNINSIT
jgi:hypothetical protein